MSTFQDGYVSRLVRLEISTFQD